jgi:hypothetical protein
LWLLPAIRAATVFGNRRYTVLASRSPIEGFLTRAVLGLCQRRCAVHLAHGAGNYAPAGARRGILHRLYAATAYWNSQLTFDAVRGRDCPRAMHLGPKEVQIIEDLHWLCVPLLAGRVGSWSAAGRTAAAWYRKPEAASPGLSEASLRLPRISPWVRADRRQLTGRGPLDLPKCVAGPPTRCYGPQSSSRRTVPRPTRSSPTSRRKSPKMCCTCPITCARKPWNERSARQLDKSSNCATLCPRGSADWRARAVRMARRTQVRRPRAARSGRKRNDRHRKCCATHSALVSAANRAVSPARRRHARGPARSALRLRGASLSVVDSLLNGKSKFMAEVDRLRQTIQAAGEGESVLFLIDEIFGGTNSHDRRVAAEAVVRTLVNRGPTSFGISRGSLEPP